MVCTGMSHLPYWDCWDWVGKGGTGVSFAVIDEEARWGVDIKWGRGLILTVICVPFLICDHPNSKADAAATVGSYRRRQQIWIFPSCWGLRRCCGPAVYHGSCKDQRWMKVQQHSIMLRTRVRNAAMLNMHQLLSTSDLYECHAAAAQ